MQRKTGQSYLFKMVSRTNYGIHIIVLVLLVACINNVVSSDVNNIRLSTLKYDVPSSTSESPTYLQNHTNIINDQNNALKNKTHRPAIISTMITTGNELWDGIIKDCLRVPTFSCFQKNVHNYLDNTLNLGDVNVTNNFVFLKNKVDVHKYTQEANDHFVDGENEIPDEEARSETPIEEVTDALSGKGIQFLMTHDIQLKLPDILFNGATFRISPRSFEGNGALVKLELMPKTADTLQTGRIFFKKIKKFFRNKLLLSFLAIVLVIKLIKIKIFWLLPLIVGVTTAKKLMLKFLLFLFPALANIFKLCSYYHKNYHDTNFHVHKHQINHLHTVVPPWFNEQHHNHGGYSNSNEPEIIYTDPPKGHPAEYLYGAPPPHQHVPQDWSSGPGLGSEYISDIHRNSQVYRPKVDDINEINSWGLGTTTPQPHTISYSQNINPLLKEAASRISSQGVLNEYNNPIFIPKKTSASNIVAQYNPVIDQKVLQLKESQKLQAQQQEAYRVQAEQKLVEQQQKILQQQPFVRSPETSGIVYDDYYSPILERIDKIFIQLGFVDEPCRERLVCSMYRNPSRFSPHSNFISAELSRDATELHKPTANNAAVIRFFKYVQAARDGQDQRDCLKIYTNCIINTEK